MLARRQLLYRLNVCRKNISGNTRPEPHRRRRKRDPCDAESIAGNLRCKTLVAHLNGPGEQALEPGHLQARNDERARHVWSDNEPTCLKTVADAASAHAPHYAFVLSIRWHRRPSPDLKIGGQRFTAAKWNKHAVRTYKANYFYDPATSPARYPRYHAEPPGSRDDEAEHIRQHIPATS